MQVTSLCLCDLHASIITLTVYLSVYRNFVICDRITVILLLRAKMIRVVIKRYFWNVSNAVSVLSNSKIN